MTLYNQQILTGKIRVRPHDRFIRCAIDKAVFTGDAAGAVWHGCRGAADFSDLKRIEMARMFGLNDFKGSTWPQGEALTRILHSPNQHDMIRAMLGDGEVDKELARILTTSYHPDNSWVPINKTLIARFGPEVQAMWDRVGLPEISEKFNETKEEIGAGQA